MTTMRSRSHARLHPDPHQERSDVAHRILAQRPVVERLEGLAVTGGAAHVGLDHDVAELTHQELHERVPVRDAPGPPARRGC